MRTSVRHPDNRTTGRCGIVGRHEIDNERTLLPPYRRLADMNSLTTPIRNEQGMMTNFLNKSVQGDGYVCQPVVRRPQDVSYYLADVYMLDAGNTTGYTTPDGRMFVEACVPDEMKVQLDEDMRFCRYHPVSREKVADGCSVYQYECDYKYIELDIPLVLYFLSRTSGATDIPPDLYTEEQIREERKNYGRDVFIIPVDCSSLPPGSVFPTEYPGIYSVSY